MGEEIAKESDDLESATESVDRYEYDRMEYMLCCGTRPALGSGRTKRKLRR